MLGMDNYGTIDYWPLWQKRQRQFQGTLQKSLWTSCHQFYIQLWRNPMGNDGGSFPFSKGYFPSIIFKNRPNLDFNILQLSWNEMGRPCWALLHDSFFSTQRKQLDSYYKSRVLRLRSNQRLTLHVVFSNFYVHALWLCSEEYFSNDEAWIEFPTSPSCRPVSPGPSPQQSKADSVQRLRGPGPPNPLALVQHQQLSNTPLAVLELTGFRYSNNIWKASWSQDIVRKSLFSFDLRDLPRPTSCSGIWEL